MYNCKYVKMCVCACGRVEGRCGGPVGGPGVGGNGVKLSFNLLVIFMVIMAYFTIILSLLSLLSPLSLLSLYTCSQIVLMFFICFIFSCLGLPN